MRCIGTGLVEHTIFLRRFENQILGKHFQMNFRHDLTEEEMAEVKQLNLENVMRNPFLLFIIGIQVAITFFIFEKLSTFN